MHKQGSQAAVVGVCLALFALCHSTQGADAVAAAAARAGVPPIAPPMTSSQVIQFLDQTIDWYRTLGLQQQAASEPSDMLFFYDNRQVASKVMSLAFDIARANADLLAKEQPFSQDIADTGISSKALLQYKQKLDSQSAAARAELDAQRRELNTASKKSKTEVEARINELEGVLDLVNTKKSILNTMTDFVTG